MGIKIQDIKATRTSQSTEVPFWKREISLGNNRISDKKKRDFYAELQLLLNAGVDISYGLTILNEGQRSDSFIQGIIDRLVKGKSLSEAVSSVSGFTDYEINSIKIGEESGRLTDVFSSLAGFYKGQVELRSQINGVLAYPIIVLILAVSITYFMLMEVVPMFQQIYASFDAELPEITQSIISISGWLKEYYLLVILFITLSLLSLTLVRKQKWFRSATSWIIQRLPQIGTLVNKIYLARFCQSMDLLISSDVPLSKAVHLVKEMIGFYPMESSLDRIEHELIQGRAFSDCLSQYPRSYESRFLSLMKVAEESGQMNIMFQRLSDLYAKDVKSTTEILGKLLEPLLIILIAVFVGFILVAMYMPLFELGNTIL